MPGKYSHSVVLADFSSRGIINLPNDQHVAYLRSSPYSASQRSRKGSNPWSDKSSVPQTRAQSALAFTNRQYLGSDPRASPGRRVIIDSGTAPGSVDIIDISVQRPSTSYNFRTSSGRGIQSPPRQTKDSVHARTTVTPTPDIAAFVDRAVPHSPQNTTLSTEAHKHNRVRAEDFLRKIPAPPASSQLQPRSPTIHQSKTTQKTRAPVLEPAAEISSKSERVVSSTSNIPNEQFSSPKTRPAGPLLQRQISQETQIYAPRTATVEPNFDGFSDIEEGTSTYFERQSNTISSMPKTAVPDGRQLSNSLKTPSPQGGPTFSLEGRARTYRSLSTERSDSGNAGEVETSPAFSSGKLDSLTSLSTISSRENGAIHEIGRKPEVSKSATKALNHEWKLPEIDEHGAFGPDFFTQGPEDLVPTISPDESVDSFLNKPLGTISAGRDIDFTRDADDESEVDAACPPDIGRHRMDDDADRLAFMSTKKSEALVMSHVGIANSAPKARKTGFFARFRSKNRA